MKNKTLKTLSLFLASMMLMCALAGCKKDAGESETSDTKGGIIQNDSTNIGDPYYDNYERDDLPEDLNYGGYEFTILCDKGQYGKSFTDAYTGDVLNSALFERGKVVESRLGVTLNVVRETGGYNDMDNFIQKLAMAGESYDLVLAYNLTPASMAIQGLLYDMSKTEYLNFDKPWWSSELVNNVSIDGKVFFTGDNSSWNNLRNMNALFVDRELFLSNHPGMKIEDLYDLVENKQWTMEKMFQLVEGTWQNKDTDTNVTAGDVFGLSCGNNVWIESWYYAAGFLTLQQNNNGDWSFNIGEQKSVDFVDWFQAKYHGSNDCYTNDSEQYKMFKEGRAQFYVSALSIVEQGLTREFTVLPMPMYDTGVQDSYVTHFANTYDMYGIPLQSPDYDRSSAVLECLASEAYRRIAPAYFENYLKSRNSSDARMADMYDVIRDGIVFDQGVIFGELFVDGHNPVYYVRRALAKYPGYESLGATWHAQIDQQYLGIWKENLNKLGNVG